MKKYIIELSTKGLGDLGKVLDDLEIKLTDQAIKEFIGKKAMQKLKEISLRKLNTVSEETIDTSAYMNAHKMEIAGNIINISNNSMVDLSNKNIKNPSNYVSGLSLAKIVEYGIGYTGGLRTNKEFVEDWEYDINNHGYKGWYYEDNAGNIHWTNGFEGRLIFAELRKEIEENISDWISEYIGLK